MTGHRRGIPGLAISVHHRTASSHNCRHQTDSSHTDVLPPGYDSPYPGSRTVVADGQVITCAVTACNLPRCRRPGQPFVCQGPWGHGAPRPDQRRRPHRPVRAWAHHPSPVRRLAPQRRADESARCRLRPARSRGLTSPAPVTASLGSQAAARLRARNPGQATE